MLKDARQHVLTINIEDYFQVGAFKQLIPYEHWARFEPRVQSSIETTLELLEATNNRATFFSSGWVAENQPRVLQSIVEAGHEIGCQGYFHHTIRDLAPAAFRQDAVRSRAIAEDAIGQEIRGFRIGRGWIGPDDLWALDILGEEGFSFDSSVCPRGRWFSENPARWETGPYPEGDGTFWEVPISAAKVGRFAMPFLGGNYMRQLPLWLIKRAANNWLTQRQAPLVMYFHTWELDREQPNIAAAGFVQRIRHYRNLAVMKARINHFLAHYSFCSASEFLDLRAPRAHAKAESLLVETSGQRATTPSAHSDSGIRTKISVIVPCYNESAAIGYLLRALENAAQAHIQDYEYDYIFVDDGSQDDTFQKLTEYFGTRDDCQVIQHAVNQGIAGAIMTGTRHAGSDLVAVIDADCTFDPHQLNEIVPLMAQDISVVSASPLHGHGALENVPRWRRSLSYGAAFLYRLVLTQKLSSYTSCFRVYRREVLADLKLWKPGFCGVAEILVRLDLEGHKFAECPAKLETRVLGESKISLLRTTSDHLSLIARVAAHKWLGIPLPQPRQQ